MTEEVGNGEGMGTREEREGTVEGKGEGTGEGEGEGTGEGEGEGKGAGVGRENTNGRMSRGVRKR